MRRAPALSFLFSSFASLLMASQSDIVVTLSETLPGGGPSRTTHVGLDADGVRFWTVYIIGYPESNSEHEVDLFYPDGKKLSIDHVQRFVAVSGPRVSRGIEHVWLGSLRRAAASCSLPQQMRNESFIGSETLVGLETYHYQFQFDNGGHSDSWYAPEVDCFPIKQIGTAADGKVWRSVIPLSYVRGGGSRFTRIPPDYEKVDDIEGFRRMFVRAYGSEENIPKSQRDILDRMRQGRGLTALPR